MHPLKNFVLSLLLLCGLFLPAAAEDGVFSRLPDDKAIVHGSLDNGLRYSLWPSAEDKGHFLIALLQQDRLTRLESVNTAQKASAADSILYSYFITVKETCEKDSLAYGTDNCRILAAGDFDAKDLLARMRSLSVALPAHQSAWEQPVREAGGEHRCRLERHALSDGSILLRYTLCAPAVNDSLSGTIVPLVSRRSWEMLSDILPGRIRGAMHAMGLACGAAECHFVPAYGLENRDSLCLDIVVASEEADQATGLLFGVLEEIRTGKTDENIIHAASNRFFFNRWSRERNFVSARERIERLKDAVLYRTDLASEPSKTEFFTSKKYKSAEEKTRFDRFAAWAIRLPEGVSPAKELPQAPRIDLSDTTAFAKAASRIRVTRSIEEAMAGATLLDFENGTSAAYKKMECGHRAWFSYVINGGEALLEHPEVSSCLETVFLSGTVNGYRTEDFLAMLAAAGIDIRFSSSFSSIMLSGSCEEKKISCLMKALVALCGHFQADESLFPLLSREQDLAGSYFPDAESEALSLALGRMHPEFAWSSAHARGPVSPEALKDAARVLRSSFRSAQNARLCLVANIPERRIQSKLRQYMGQFHTERRLYARYSIPYLTLSGTMRLGLLENGGSLLTVSSFDAPGGLDHQLCEHVAVSMVRERLCRELGTDISIRIRRTLHPKENLDIVSLFPESVSKEGMHRLETILDEMASGAVGEAAFKRAVADEHNLSQSLEGSPFYWMDLLYNRQVYGKDYRTGLSDRLDKLSVQGVSAFCQRWKNAGRVEVVLEK
ncbi:MAG: hypothetical protein J6Y32_08305 [Bacteroidales bacterium]|nr:hypothetical protein [Bacteroidales bacterium]